MQKKSGSKSKKSLIKMIPNIEKRKQGKSRNPIRNISIGRQREKGFIRDFIQKM